MTVRTDYSSKGISVNGNQPALFKTTCHECCGTSRIPDPKEPDGSGWTLPCPRCASTSDLLEGRREYDPDRAHIPY